MEERPLQKRLSGDNAPEALLESFLSYLSDQTLELYPAQEEAILELVTDKNVILNTPTGSGKSLVATAALFFAITGGRRSYYTCPIKALVNEKFFALCREFGAENVGMLTGDASINADAPLVCCTAEILANMALRLGDAANIDRVVMDEFHYYGDRDRGMAWQIPLLTLPQSTFLLMSATLGDTAVFEAYLAELTKKPTVTVRSTERPVPLDFSYRLDPLHETIVELVEQDKAPIYLVNFTQRACAEQAQKLMSQDFCTKDQKRAIAKALYGTRFDSPYGKTIQRFVRHGIGLHHAGLLPKYRLLVEKLCQGGHLKIISGTDTLGVGVNIPIRTVLFTQLCKYDGEKSTLLSVRDFQQISGRAGRRGFDSQGSVVVQAPEHVIANKRLTEKAKKKKLVLQKPPAKGYVAWDEKTFERLVHSSPEPLQPTFHVSHATVLNTLERTKGGCKALVRLIRDCHVSGREKAALRVEAKQLFRSLVDGEVIGIQNGVPHVNADLQHNFSLDQSLALYLLDTLDRLDPELPTHALDILSLAEAIVENPDVVLRRQLDKLKTEKMSEMKAAGVDYEERLVELEKLEYPKPNREFTYHTFNAFAEAHPWVGQDNIRPKSIAREMFEMFYAFGDYIKEYGLERAEGVLLRYLTQVYKVLVQTVPSKARSEELDEVIAYLHSTLKRVDSSLLTEWEQMQELPAHPEATGAPRQELDQPEDITRDTRGFTIWVRNEVFRLVRALAHGRYQYAEDILQEMTVRDDLSKPSLPFGAARLDGLMRAFNEANGPLMTHADARSARYLRLERHADLWLVEQVLVAEEPTEWVLRGRVNIPLSRESGRMIFDLTHFGPPEAAET